MISGYINSVPFSVYYCGEIMILDTYYIKWLPSYISSGTFTIGSSTYNFSDYSSGELSGFTTPITSWAFYSNQDITSIDTDAFGIKDYAFYLCPALTTVNMSNCQSISRTGFGYCPSLSYINIPNCRYIGGGCFVQCSSLSEINLPNVITIEDGAFEFCSLLTLNLPKCEYIGDAAFLHNVDFSTISLGASSVCVLSSSGAFRSTGITSSTGSIVVPMSLYSEYIVASEWSYFYNRIFPELGSNYIRWTPVSVTGTFKLDGTTYNFSDYSSGYFIGYSWITSSAFQSTGIVTVETDTYRVDDKAFDGCTNLEIAQMYDCEYVGKYAFHSTKLSSIYLPSCSKVDSCAFMSCTLLSSVNLPVCNMLCASAFKDCNITYLSLPECISIMSDAFVGNSNLAGELYLPKCEYISSYAFSGCSLLTSIDLPECSYIANSTFIRCSSVSTVSLPECKYVGQDAFLGCNLIREISLPKCVDIGAYAFAALSYDQWNNHANLYSITLSSYSMCILRDSRAFQSTNITSSTGYIIVAGSRMMDYKVASEWSYFSNRIFSVNGQSNYMKWTPTNMSGSFKYNYCTYYFSDYSSGYFSMFDSIIIGGGYNGSLFQSNSTITTIETDLVDIQGYLFADCSRLSFASLSKCVDIGVYVFKSCGVKEVYAPVCEWVEDSAFQYCSNLSSIYLPVCSKIGSYAFEGTSITEVYYLSLKSVGRQVFKDCVNLVSVGLPLLKEVGGGMFSGCINLSDVYLPNVTWIMGYAFTGCYSLSSISLPECYNIYNYAFAGTGLKTITLGYSSGVCVLSSTAFAGCSLSEIYVPSGLVNSYKNNSMWSSYSSIIYPIPV